MYFRKRKRALKSRALNFCGERLKLEPICLPATVVRYLSALSHAFTIAVREWGWLEDSPMRKVTKLKEARGGVPFLDEEERERLLSACKASSNPHLYPVYWSACPQWNEDCHARIQNNRR